MNKMRCLLHKEKIQDNSLMDAGSFQEGIRSMVNLSKIPPTEKLKVALVLTFSEEAGA